MLTEVGGSMPHSSRQPTRGIFGYIRDLWQGNLSLPISFWVNGKQPLRQVYSSRAPSNHANNGERIAKKLAGEILVPDRLTPSR